MTDYNTRTVVDDQFNRTEGNGVTAPRARPSRPSRAEVARWSRFALPVLLLVLVATFSVLEPTYFATVDNARTILVTQTVLATLAMSALFTLVVGQFDLSIGAQLGLAQVVLPGLLSRYDVDLGTGIVITIAVTTVIGAFNGVLVAKLRLNSFIATLGVATILQATVLWYSGGRVIFEGLPPSLTGLSTAEIVGIPLPIVYIAILAILAWLVLERTPLGRRMEAVGVGHEAARLSGINADGITILAFCFGGALAGAAGVLQASQIGSGNPALGPEFLLPAFAAVFLGATAFKVGRFNLWGTIVAVLTVATGVAGLNLMGVPQWVNPLFNGVALLLAVTAARLLRGVGSQ
ncbi:ABC transporter permease [Rhodococcus sp. USK13]|uniref:ABC transporter permease n=1 Tax=Rhodococcus sp. USK13 TaxID=2806442 RepID=UPI001BCE16EB|nr:ABC transporter permease [Rhodococcus sp. USK13]